MKRVLLATLTLSIFFASCSKKDNDKRTEPKADFTAIAGDWKGLSSSDADIFTINGRGTFLSIGDSKVNSDAINGGTVLIFTRTQSAASTTYNAVPYTDAALGNVSQSSFAKTGMVLTITKTPTTDQKSKLAVRGIIIPAGKSIPPSVNGSDYTAIAKYLNISN